MATDTSTMAPYIAFKPGDPIRAEDQVQMQLDIKKDIQDQVKAAEDRITKGSVAHADDSTKFDGLTDPQWIDKLNKLYAPIVHDHEGVSGYRRYFKKFSSPSNLEAILLHKLGRLPEVDPYVLLPVFSNVKVPPPPEAKIDANCRFVLYHGDEDATLDNGLLMRVPNEDDQLLGIQLDALLKELGIQVVREEAFVELVKKMWRVMRQPPNDDIKTCELPWVTDCCDKRFTVGQLQDDKEWEQIWVGFRAVKCGLGGVGEFGSSCLVVLSHVNYSALYISAAGAFGQQTVFAARPPGPVGGPRPVPVGGGGGAGGGGGGPTPAAGSGGVADSEGNLDLMILLRS